MECQRKWDLSQFLTISQTNAGDQICKAVISSFSKNGIKSQEKKSLAMSNSSSKIVSPIWRWVWSGYLKIDTKNKEIEVNWA